MESFRKAMEHPKLARWFSWNSTAGTQLSEYYTLRMLLEFSIGVGNGVDPDGEDAIPFDRIIKEGRRNPRAVFQALKAAKGGFQLCYTLLSTALLRY